MTGDSLLLHAGIAACRYVVEEYLHGECQVRSSAHVFRPNADHTFEVRRYLRTGTGTK